MNEPYAPEIRILDDAAAVAREACERIAAAARAAAAARGRFSFALSGGPVALASYRLLAEAPSIPWESGIVLVGDECRGEPGDAASSFRGIYESLLGRVPHRPGHVCRFWGEGPDPAFVVAHYEAMVRGLLGAAAGAVPALDLVVLDLSRSDASAPPEAGGARLAAFVRERYTITEALVREAARVLVLAAGRREPATVPGGGTVTWLVDRGAAAFL